MAWCLFSMKPFIWTNANILLTRYSGTNFSQISITTWAFENVFCKMAHILFCPPYVNSANVHMNTTVYYQLDPKEQTSVKQNSKYNKFLLQKCMWKYRLPKGSHLVLASMVNSANVHINTRVSTLTHQRPPVIHNADHSHQGNYMDNRALSHWRTLRMYWLKILQGSHII